MIGKAVMPLRNFLVKVLCLKRESLSHKMMKVLITFLLFVFSVIFFRATSVTEATEIIASIIKNFNPWILFDGSLYTCGLERKNFTVMLVGIGILLFADYLKYKNIKVREVIMQQDWWFRYLLMAGSIVIIVLLGIWGTGYNEASFIYFQF